MVDMQSLIGQTVEAVMNQLGEAQAPTGGFMGGNGKGKGFMDGQPPRKRGRFGKDGAPLPADGPPQTAEVRFDDTPTAQRAVEALNGSLLGGSTVTVEMDAMSKDATRIRVYGIPSNCDWQELKDHFNQIGRVAFAEMKGKGRGRPTSNLPVAGVVRFESSDDAQNAVDMLNASQMINKKTGESVSIEVKLHGGSSDRTKIMVHGMPPGTEWQELKDHFGQIGRVVFTETLSNTSEPGVERIGEVRYDEPDHAQQALQALNGSKIGGAQIFVQVDPHSKDGSRLMVHGIPPGIEWQELKDHFQAIGRVAYCDVKGKGKGKGGKGKGKGGKDMGHGGMMGGPSMMMNFMSWMNNGQGGGGKGGKGSKGGKQYGTGPEMVGQIAYANPMHGQVAISMLNYSALNGGNIQVDWDWQDETGTCLWVGGVPSGTSQEELQGHFSCIGLVTFCDMKQGP